MLVEKAILYTSLVFGLLILSGGVVVADNNPELEYERARWHPSHFKPEINTTTDEQCLSCHQEIIERKVLEASPAGVKVSQTLAWYQTLHTYKGEQETFHRRHLVTPMAQNLMDMKCNTCHQGNDPREEAPPSPSAEPEDIVLRKMVDPDICLMCHGAHPAKIMGLPGPWPESRDAFQNNCLLCHAGIRTNRHQVDFLKAQAIEEAAAKDGDVCYGCHGGRQWYRIAYPYARNPWPGMAKEVPEWAKERPTQSQARFRVEPENAAE